MSYTRRNAPERPSPGPSSVPVITDKDGEVLNSSAPGDASAPSSRKPIRRVTIESPPQSRSRSRASYAYYGSSPRAPSPESPGSNDATVGQPPTLGWIGQPYTETPQNYPQGLAPLPQTYLPRPLGYQPSPDFDPIVWADIYGATNSRDTHAPTPQSAAVHLPARLVPPPPGPPHQTEHYPYDSGYPGPVPPFAAHSPQAAYGGSFPTQPYGSTSTPLAQPYLLFPPLSQAQSHSPAYHIPPPVSQPYHRQAAPSVFQHEIPGVFSAYAPHSFPVQLPLAATEQNWPDLLKHCQTSDEALIQKWDDEINALLVYAGLFSAVVTAFVIESYQLLQPDMGGQTVAGLASMSRQLEILITGGGPTSQTAAFTLPNDAASASAVALNALWLLSLIAALISASSAILLKQTFREYKTWSNVPRPLEALRLRQLRFHAFRTWRVSDIVASLPATLEVAVLLFMAGLPLFVWNHNVTLFVIITAVAGCFLVTTLVVTILPALNFDFPYKSPVAWALWKARVYTTDVFRYRFGLNKSGLPTTQADNIEKTYPEFSSTSSSASWQERDLRVSKAKELQHLWDLLRWFCSSWSDHRLHSAVRACMSDLIYRSNALNTAYHNYIDVIETALPTVLDMPPTHLYPALLQANQLPQELIRQLFPFALVDTSSVRRLNAKLAQLPWKMLALLFDEVVAGLRVAVRDDFSSSMYDQDKNKALAVASLCFLECLMERVKTEQLQSAFDESRIALICDISCHIMASVLPSSSLNVNREEDAYASSAPKIRSLEDIALSWIGGRNDLVISRDNCLRMLFAADVRKSAILDARGGIPKANDMRLFATLTSLALDTVTRNAYLEDPVVADAYKRAISSIDSVVRLSYEKSISNCGMGATEFPWTMILSNSARSLSEECRDKLAKGFHSGLFTSRDPAEQIALLQALMTSSGPNASGRSQSHDTQPSLSRPRQHSFSPYYNPYNPQLTPVTEQAQSTSSSTFPQEPGPTYPPTPFVPPIHSPPSAPYLPPSPFLPPNPFLPPGLSPQSSRYPSPDRATRVWNDESDDMVMLAPAHSAFAGFSGSNELHFRAGDVIEVLDRTYDWWWTGRLRDRIGLFPVDYVTTSLASKHSRHDMPSQVEPLIPSLSMGSATLSPLTESRPAVLPVIVDHASHGSIGKHLDQVGSEETLLMRQASSLDSPTAFNVDDETNTVTQDRPAYMNDTPKETADINGNFSNNDDSDHDV